MIALVDYGAGNLTSVRKALGALGAEFWTPTAATDLSRARGVIVPGVGHFSSTAALDEGWRRAIRGRLAEGTPLLGICVGLQWLFEGSSEAPGVPGFGALPGCCARLEDGGSADASSPGASGERRLKVPHVGWNSLSFPRPTRLFAGLSEGTQVYFTHSYAAPLVDATAAVTSYGSAFSAGVEDGLIAGVQFHPEKSSADGLALLANFVGTCVPAVR